MNIVAYKAAQLRKEEMESIGFEEYRLQALQNLKLKTVIKESHCTPVHALSFNQTSPNLANLFATVGKDQTTVYDDDHMTDHVSVVVQFTNEPTEYTQGGDLTTCCWVSAQGWNDHLQGDACLAVAGIDNNISIISITESRVIKLLQGHTKDVIEMAATSSNPTLLLSLSKDGSVKLWDVVEEKVLSSVATDGGNCLAIKEDGSGFVVGTTRGRLFSYSIGSSGIVEDSKHELKMQNGSHSEAIDCMKFIPAAAATNMEGSDTAVQQNLITKSWDGRIFVWNMTTLSPIAAWRVPGCGQLGPGLSGRCQFGTTKDGRYVVVGNGTGDVYVYDSSDGKRISHTSSIRVSAPVRACGITDDCRHIVAAIGRGFLFRWEYLGKQAQEEENDENDDENKDEGGDGVDKDDAEEEEKKKEEQGAAGDGVDDAE